MYNYNQNFRPQYSAQIQGLKGRPVSSLEEVMASTVDFDGSISYFPDLSNQKIYTKQINPDGSSSLLMYEKKEIPQTPIVNNNEYITRNEFNEIIAELKKTLISIENEKEFKF